MNCVLRRRTANAPVCGRRVPQNSPRAEWAAVPCTSRVPHQASESQIAKVLRLTLTLPLKPVFLAARLVVLELGRGKGRSGKTRQRFIPGANAPSLYYDRVITADKQRKADHNAFARDGPRRLCNLAEPGAIWHVAVTLTRQTPQTQKGALLSCPCWLTPIQFAQAVYKT